MINHLTLLSIASLFFSVSFSQITSGISAGLAFSDVKGATQFSSDNSFKVGYQATIFVEYGITKNLRIRPSLGVTQKGCKSVLSNGHRPFFLYWKRELSYTYLETPVNIIYQVPIRDVYLILGSGPVVSYGMYGSRKTTLVESDYITQEVKTSISIEKNIFKNKTNRRFDFGWNLLLGARYRRSTLQAAYNYGLSATTTDDSPNPRNRSFSFAIGYLLIQ